MKSLQFLPFLFTLPLLCLAQPRQQPREPLIVDEGTHVRLRLMRSLSSADLNTGDRIHFEVVEDVVAKNRINGRYYLVIERGAVALGTITDVEQDRHLGRGDKLGITLDSVRLADGGKMALDFSKEYTGGRHLGPMIFAIAVTGEPLFLLINGKDKIIHEGIIFDVDTMGRADLDSQYFEVRDPR